LAQIIWDNFLAGSNFEVYGANESIARSIAIRAITDWSRVISDFNYDSGGNTFHLELTVGGAAGCGGSASITGVEASSRKPTHAETRLHSVGCGNGFYFTRSSAPATCLMIVSSAT
jgi:hypothetical protein